MPVRSLNSRVLKWPDAEAVVTAFGAWAADAARSRTDVVRIGYFGSYARGDWGDWGDWGVGSDLDVVIVLERTDLPFERRSVEWDLADLPVPADVLVYTEDEWGRMEAELGFVRTAAREAVWVYVKD